MFTVGENELQQILAYAFLDPVVVAFVPFRAPGLRGKRENLQIFFRAEKHRLVSIVARAHRVRVILGVFERGISPPGAGQPWALQILQLLFEILQLVEFDQTYSVTLRTGVNTQR